MGRECDTGRLALTSRWQDEGVQLIWFGAGLLVLVALTLGVQHAARLHMGWSPLVSSVRAAVQLSVIAVLLRGVLTVPWTVALFILLMASTASLTAGRRVHELHRGRLAALGGVVAGAAVTLALVFVLRLVHLDARYVVSMAGIVIGNCMSAATLAGRNFLRGARARSAEVEGWLALGARPLQAFDDVGRVAVREALLPTIDQTANTGMVTLPGAFVGALFGGASPVQAAQFQLVVLVGLMLAQTVTALVVVTMAGRSPVVPVERQAPPTPAPARSTSS